MHRSSTRILGGATKVNSPNVPRSSQVQGVSDVKSLWSVWKWRIYTMIYPPTMAAEWQKWGCGHGMEWGYPVFSDQRRWGVFWCPRSGPENHDRWIAEAPHLWTNHIPCVWACKDHLLEKVHKLAFPMVLDRKTPKTIGNTQILLLIIIFPIKINMNWRS